LIRGLVIIHIFPLALDLQSSAVGGGFQIRREQTCE
jgi:hypothetical protein